ncbi:MAG: hypothetical protein AAF829_04795 [Pseudomonadota bacterium]
MDERDRYAFELGWRLVGMTLDALGRLPGVAAGFLWSADWARAFRGLRHAEQVARRLIIAEAGRLIASGEITAPRSGDPGKTALSVIHRVAPRSGDPGKTALSAIHRAAPRSGDQKTNPTFALFEPLPDPHFLGGLIEADPSGRRTGLATPQQKPRDTRGLSNRIAALQAVFDDPRPAARRMARFLLVRRARRSMAILPGHPPAFRPRQFLDWSMDVLMQAHDAALRVMNTPRAPPCAWIACPQIE